MKKLLILLLVYTMPCMACDSNLEFSVRYQINPDSLNSFKEYKIVLEHNDINEGQFNKVIEEHVRISGTIFNCMGEISFAFTDSINNIRINGQFINGLDILKRQEYIVDPFTDKGYVILKNYIEPLEDGEWNILYVLTNRNMKVKYKAGFQQ